MGNSLPLLPEDKNSIRLMACKMNLNDVLSVAEQERYSVQAVVAMVTAERVVDSREEDSEDIKLPSRYFTSCWQLHDSGCSCYSFNELA